jgi:hypothetical protein
MPSPISMGELMERNTCDAIPEPLSDVQADESPASRATVF